MPESSPQNQAPSANGSSPGLVLVVLLLTLVGGYLLFSFGRSAPGAEPWREAAAAPRVQLPVALSPSQGPDDALVTVVEFADFQCPFCAHSVGLRQQLLREFPAVRWVFKQFPLPFHAEAREAASAALAAHAQGQFWPFHDRLFADQAHLSPSDLTALAKELGLDVARFASDLKAADRLVGEDVDLAKKIGVRATPSFIVNGRQLTPGANYQLLAKAVRQEILWARELLMRGVPRARIYEELTKATAPSGAGSPASQPSPPPAARAPAAGGSPAQL
jgi:protein-disulfide isomerase